MDYETHATAFALLHGNPPKSLRYRHGLFEVKDVVAVDYRIAAEQYVLEHVLPEGTSPVSPKVRAHRNNLLRTLHQQLGIESK